MSNDNSQNNDKTPLERFEDLAKRMFSVVKKDVETAETVVKDVVEPPDCEPTSDE